MAFSKTITVASVGAPASYHVADNYNFSRTAQATSVMILSYLDEDAFKAGLSSIGSWTNIMLDGFPPDGDNPFTWADALIVQAQPTDAQSSSSFLPGSANRYLLAGAEIVA